MTEADRLSCQVVVEDGKGYRTEEPVQQTAYGGDLTYQLKVLPGFQLVGTDGMDCELEAVETEEMYELYELHLNNVKYTQTVTPIVEYQTVPIYYDANGGSRLDGKPASGQVKVDCAATHLTYNTSIGTDLFYREGYTLLGWNTEPDGSGISVGLGSRIEHEFEYNNGKPEQRLTLYAMWSAWDAPASFNYEKTGDGITITGVRDWEQVCADGCITVPDSIEGMPVWEIGEGAFAGSGSYQRIVLPLTMRKVRERAFAGSHLRELYVFDTITNISDYAVEGCEDFTTLHINAQVPPVYAVNYFATFADKVDYLKSLAGHKKLVLFSGSSTRFGYDSEKLEKAFRQYHVANMGVFAYTNAYPQLMVLAQYMEEGDVLLHTPEFDAAKRQFCTDRTLEPAFFCMCEENYDILGLLDLRQFTGVFSSFTSYLSTRKGMEALTYANSPRYYDEDGQFVNQVTYNRYGDYILERPDADTDAPVYGLEVEYTKAAFPEEEFLEPYREVCSILTKKGIQMLFGYAPRNREAISKDSTKEAREELDRYFRLKLSIPVIGTLEESLYPGKYLYGTDNHLSTNGVAIRTERVIHDLGGYLR